MVERIVTALARLHAVFARRADETLPGAARLGVARALGVTGLVAYNWWVMAPFLGWVHSPDALFSDLSASGQPHAVVMQQLDLAAGLLLLAALVLRGPFGHGRRRPEWKWLVAFAAAAAVGGRYPYACASGLDPACRTLERHLELPFHHYVHMAAGVTEFCTVTFALWVAHRRRRGEVSTDATLLRVLVATLLVAYPLLAVAYLADRWGTVVEPLFFVVFTSLVLRSLFEPTREVAEASVAVDTVVP